MINVFLLALVFTVLLMGFSWCYQLVHLKTYRFIASPNFPESQRTITKLTTRIYLPLILVDSALTAYLTIYYRNEILWWSCVLLAFVLFITGALISPIQGKLLLEKNGRRIRQLYYLSGTRNLMLTGKSILILSLLWSGPFPLNPFY